eukprot:1147644-Prymnesium_polylepis.1
MTCAALRWVVVALGLRGHAAALLGDAGWTHAAHAGRSVVWGSRNVRMAQQLPEDGPAAAWCVGAAEDGGDAESIRMQQEVSIDKPRFGGGSGGTATLDDTDFSVNTILKQLESIQQGTPKNI